MGLAMGHATLQTCSNYVQNYAATNGHRQSNANMGQTNAKTIVANNDNERNKSNRILLTIYASKSLITRAHYQIRCTAGSVLIGW